MAERLADGGELAVDELRRKARRRLVGAIVLALAAAILVPMLLENEPRPLGDDVAIQIPPLDDGRFVNRLTGAGREPKAAKGGTDAAGTSASPSAPGMTAPASSPAPATPGASGATSADSVVQVAPAQSGAQRADAASTTRPAGAGKSVTEAEQRVLAPSVKPPPKTTSVPAQPSSEAASTPAPTMPSKPEVALAPATAQPKSDGDAKRENEAKSAPEAKPGTSAPVAVAAAPTNGFVVQLAAFADDKGANALANKLKRANYAAYVEPVTTSRGTLWRVRVGGYASRTDADAARTKLKDEGYSGIVAPAK